MNHRRPFRRRPRDIVSLALKSLGPSEELLCTAATYRNIRERVEAFMAHHGDRAYRVIGWGGIQKVKRIA